MTCSCRGTTTFFFYCLWRIWASLFAFLWVTEPRSWRSILSCMVMSITLLILHVHMSFRAFYDNCIATRTIRFDLRFNITAWNRSFRLFWPLIWIDVRTLLSATKKLWCRSIWHISSPMYVPTREGKFLSNLEHEFQCAISRNISHQWLSV